MAEGVPASSLVVFGDREDPTQAGVLVLSFDAPKVMNDVADTKAKLANGALRSFLVSSGETLLTPRTHVRTCFCLLLTPLIATLNCRSVELELFGRGDSVSDALHVRHRTQKREEFVPPSSHGCAYTITACGVSGEDVTSCARQTSDFQDRLLWQGI